MLGSWQEKANRGARGAWKEHVSTSHALAMAVCQKMVPVTASPDRVGTGSEQDILTEQNETGRVREGRFCEHVCQLGYGWRGREQLVAG